MSVEQIECITLSEDDLFELDDFVDNLLAVNQSFREDGVLLFNVNSGPGTSLTDFISQYKDNVKESLNRLNPTFVPQSEGCYGHISIPGNNLTPEEVSICTDILNQPSNYSVSDNNCCISALSEGGTEGLLSHYYDDVFAAQASEPPQFKRSTGSYSVDASSLNKYNELVANKTACKSKMSPAEKKELLCPTAFQEQNKKKKKKMKKKKEEEENDESLKICQCWMCLYSDEVLGEAKVMFHDEAETEVKPLCEQTAKFFQGKGFFYANGLNVIAPKYNMISSNFSLSFLNKLTLTCLLDRSYEGINTPFLYFGFQHSFFPIHYEDLSLFSLNFLHHGSPKGYCTTILCLQIGLFSLERVYMFIHGTCINLLGHKYHVPTPSWLKRRGIPFKVVVQRCRQGVIVAPNAAHFGFNMQGANIAEAVNFGSKSWIPYGIVYPKCTCMPGQVHADLSAIIGSYCPDMMEAYRHRKIPAVPSQPDFIKRIVYPHLWADSFEKDHDPHCNVPSEESCDAVEPEVYLQPERKLKKCAKRKVIMCPVCDQVYQGGHKKRLLQHLKSVHKTLPKKDKVRVNKDVKVMFPQWGDKLPKKVCPLCGTSVARSMKAHQKSKACIPKATGSCV